MRQKKTDGITNERGEIMLEASIIFVSIVILLLVLLSLSFLFYQQSMMTSVANEIAADIAKNYKFTDLDMGSNLLSLDDILETKMFRTTFNMNSYESAHKNRADKYANWRISLTSLGLNPQNITVDCEITRSGIGRAYVKVTVSQKTDFFLSGVLEMTKVADKNTLFSATAYAECVDLIGYTSIINYTAYLSGELSPLNGVGKLYSSAKDLYKSIVDFIGNLMG